MLTKQEQYKLTKEMLFAKFDGVCAFCGYPLGERWHIWDIESKNTIVTASGEIIIGNDSYNNKLPACISCNSTRIHHSPDKHSKIDIEKFRIALRRDHWFISTNTYYQKMLRFGIIKETGNEIIFHFEKTK